jgi:hypothetical protein
MTSLILAIILNGWLVSQAHANPAQDIGQAQTVAELSEHTTTQEAVVKVVRGTGISAGIASVDSSCSAALYDFYLPRGMSISDAMDKLTATDGHHKWQISDGVIMVFPNRGIPSPLQTKINHVHISNKKNLTLAVNELLQTVEVRESFSRLKVFVQSPELGFQKLDRSISRTSEEPIDLTNISLGTALNVLATEQTNAVWSYNERVCGERKMVRLEFISK